MIAPTFLDELATRPDQCGCRNCVHPLDTFLGLTALAMLLGRSSLAIPNSAPTFRGTP